MSLKNILSAVAGIGGVQFASLTYTAKGTGEVARHTVILGASYTACIEKSLAALSKARFSCPVKRQAQAELVASFNETLAKHAIGQQNSAYTKAETYVSTDIAGVKLNTVDGSLKLFGLTVGKVVIKPGTYKSVKSAPLTIAKNTLRKRLPVGKFREYAIEAGALESARVNGATLELA